MPWQLPPTVQASSFVPCRLPSRLHSLPAVTLDSDIQEKEDTIFENGLKRIPPARVCIDMLGKNYS